MNSPENIIANLKTHLTSQADRKYCLTPINMVPNGPPHLGHVSGPLLRMDVLRRHLLRRGAAATFVMTTDVHETHVVVKGKELGLSPSETANMFHDEITDSLTSLDITYDTLINPLDPKWVPVYSRVTKELMDAMVTSGTSKVMSESLPMRADNGSYVLGGWLAGNCPNCGAELVSFFCEDCGDQTTPSKLLNPKHRIDDVVLEWKDDKSLFFELPSKTALTDQLDRMAIRRDFREIADQYLARNGPVFRLSLPDPWGEPCNFQGLSEGHVTFSYSAALVAAQILSGECYKELTGTDVNPFAAESDVTIVSSFGIDNAVPMLIGVLGIGVAQSTFRPPDHFLTNYFYTLAGDKFSTNRQHAIWAADICQKSDMSTDLFRTYMVPANPEYELSNFDIEDFLMTSNALINTTETAVARAKAKFEVEDFTPGPVPADVAHRLIKSLYRQAMAMDLRDFSLLDMLSPIEAWLKSQTALCGTSLTASYWWVKSLALLCWPVMPKLGQWIWQQLGHAGAPNGTAFNLTPMLAIDGSPTPLGALIDHATLDAVLPSSLANRAGRTQV